MPAFKCPKCGALPHKHGKGGKRECISREDEACEGLICDCDDYERSNEKNHGTSFLNPCHEANCYHCGYGGVMPQKPKGLEMWEKKALEAGWAPPASRRKELGL
jgi:hypothetical protein